MKCCSLRLAPHQPWCQRPHFLGTSGHQQMAPFAKGAWHLPWQTGPRENTRLPRQADSCLWENVCFAASPPSTLAALACVASQGLGSFQIFGENTSTVTWVKLGLGGPGWSLGWSELGQPALHPGGPWQCLVYYRRGVNEAKLSPLIVTDLTHLGPPRTPGSGSGRCPTLPR